jgi:hypothetical protein
MSHGDLQISYSIVPRTDLSLYPIRKGMETTKFQFDLLVTLCASLGNIPCGLEVYKYTSPYVTNIRHLEMCNASRN